MLITHPLVSITSAGALMNIWNLPKHHLKPIHIRFIGSTDYTLFDKDGVSIFIFQNDMVGWSQVYCEWPDDVREACIDALILRFQKLTEMVYYKGDRKVVEFKFATGVAAWFVIVNKFFRGQITFSEHNMQFIRPRHNPDKVLTSERIEKYKDWIRDGQIKCPEEWR